MLWPLTAGCLLAGLGSHAMANPVGASVVSGQASFAQQGKVLTVTNSPNAIIQWSGFSIQAGEVTRFVQQNSSSSVLNRITGQDPSLILGTLQSNGKVYLLNPNGILFGAGAQVEVGGLVASTLAITDADFIAGQRRYSAGPVAGEVRNLGNITITDGGQVLLIGTRVSNAGIITSPRGEVTLAAGQSVQLADSLHPELQVVVSAAADQALNLGQVIAPGGRINLFGALVNQRGRLSADSAVVGEDGRILLKSSRSTVLEAGSVTSATGAGSGGQIQVLGQQVALTGNARVDASGDKGGGTVLVGGSYRHNDAGVMNASQTLVDCDATVSADARIAGNGGTVVIWGERTAQVYGTLSARGGTQSGNGGSIETSGGWLDLAGARVDASAPRGSQGSWLLDPYDLIVGSRGAALTVGGVRFADADSVGTSTTINAGLISAASADVILEATHDLTFNAAVAISTSGVGLTARAGNDINVNAALTTQGGNIVLAANAGSVSSGSGLVNRNAQIDAGSGSITITDSTTQTVRSVMTHAQVVQTLDTLISISAPPRLMLSPAILTPSSTPSTIINPTSPTSSGSDTTTAGTTAATTSGTTPGATSESSSSPSSTDGANTDGKTTSNATTTVVTAAKATINERATKMYCN